LDDDSPATSSQEQRAPQFSINDISRFSFASIIPHGSTADDDAQKDSLDVEDFLAPINFDEFHNSITTDEPSLSHFPLPGRGPSNAFRPVEENKTLLPQPINPPASTRRVSGTTSISRKNSLARQQNLPSAGLSRTSSKSESVTTGPATSVLRSRRQSHFPPNSYSNANTGAKVPRKSIGPGTFIEPDPSENKSSGRRPSVGIRKASNEHKIMTGLNIGVAKLGVDAGGNEELGVMGHTKNFSGKSGQGAKRDSEKGFLTASRTPDPSRGSGRTKSRSGTPGTVTPSSNVANKRMSVMPGIATGLGARTISPTDARRMKRMSMAPPAPPLPPGYLPHAPPTPQPEPTLTRSGSLLRSPGPRGGKSATPSSLRTTPDPNRKSYSSGQSLSSSTSFGSVRNSTGVPPLPAGTSSSRLPTPKPQLEALSISSGDEVPPVPAIPKAYESPQSEAEQPFFSARSSGLLPTDTPISASPHAMTFEDALKAIDIPRAPSASSRKHSYTSQPDAEQRQRPPPSTAKKSLAPLRLPPLNLLPLSTPTAAKIKALEDEAFDSAERPLTPPGRYDSTKTPSTPLTASKAMFFSRGHYEHDDTSNKQVRSSTSHHALRAPSDASIDAPFSFDSGTPGPRIISPFTSSSLPKNSGEFSRYMQPKYNGDLSRINSQARPSGPRAPSFSVGPKSDAKATPTQQESSTSTSVLRRKLSRKRSENKVQEVVEKDVDASKYDNMPPPKLPASAAWNNMPATSTSPTQRPNYLSSRRNTSVSNTNGPPAAERQGSFSSIQSQSHSLEGRPSVESNRSFTSHSHQAARNPLVMNGKASSVGQAHTSDGALDRDDMIAEEEMRKLGAKRKDFETAARELDALRRRACPGDRISVSYALQTMNLNLFERGEIVDFRDVYFTGTRNANKIVGDLNAASTNFGYDDERGDYNIVEGDHLAYRYEVVDLLGKGSFGQVVRCVDHKTGILVAIKIIRNKKRFHQQALVEVNILQKLREWVSYPEHSVS
jgi:dual specificity tyrosine-phosphorylation-regulated kinase 2/3/4